MDKTKMTRGQVSPTPYKPLQPGDSIAGICRGLRTLQGDDGSEYQVVLIEDSEGVLRSVYAGDDVAEYITDHELVAKPILLEYAGQQTTRRGRKRNIWEIWH